MEIVLTPELEKLIQLQIDCGNYPSATAVIAAGLELLTTIENVYQGCFEELRQEVMVGVEAPERGEVLDAEEVFRRMQEKLDATG